MHQYKVFILLIQVFLLVQTSLGSFERSAQPTSLFGRGFSGSALFAPNNVWLNPASIARNSTFESSLFYSPSPFELPQLSNFGFIALQKFNSINISTGYSSYGFSLYRETVFSLSAAAVMTESFAVGVSIHANHLSIQSYGSAITPAFDIGTIISVTENFALGISLNNLNRSTFGSDDDIPQTFISGISYAVTKNAVIAADVVKDVRYPTMYRAGFDFSPIDIVTLRAGTQSEQFQIYGGIGLRVSSFRIDYGIATHSELGLTHSIGISFSN